MATSQPTAGHAAAFVLGGAAAAVCTACLLERRRARHKDLLPPPADGSRSPPSFQLPHGEPDAEPDTEHHAEHKEFVRVLRVARQSEPEEPSYWTAADIPESSDMHFAIRELKTYFAEFKQVGHDPFWQRKSKKLVLAVVVCRLADGSFQACRGMNTEVSLPSGSLCAERAGIARAASDWRAAQQIVCVAVLDPEDTINPLWPCEVCQSWLAKLRDQNDAISVLAFKDSQCDEFVVRINGVLQPRPRQVLAAPSLELTSRITRAEGVEEQPWEAESLAYVDGSFTSLDQHHYALLRAAAAAGSHVLVGLHSDATLEERTGSRPSEDLKLRCGRVLEDRHVHSVLEDAPWCVTRDFISSLGIKHVITGAKGEKTRCKDEGSAGVYDAARGLGILTVVPLS